MTLIEEDFDDTLVIVRRTGPGAVLVAVRGGELPHIYTVGHHPADVTPVRSAVRDHLRLDTVVLDCRRVAVADGVVRRLLVLESLDSSSAATAVEWVATPDLGRAISGEPGDAAILADVSGASTSQTALPDGQDWSRPGWWRRATEWITQKVHAARFGHVVAIEQIRAWEFSCVLRVQTDHAEDLYFKALPRAYAHEPRLARHLANVRPGLVPEVVATNPRERWLLMRACHGQALETAAPVSAWERAAASYADLQVASIAHANRLRALGCRQRGPLDLRSLIGPLLSDEAALLGAGGYGLSLDELRRLHRLRPGLEAACDELADSGLPMSLEHGDLWSSNVYVSESGGGIHRLD